MHEYAADATAIDALDPVSAIDPGLWRAFTETTGFMPEDEARALYAAAVAGPASAT